MQCSILLSFLLNTEKGFKKNHVTIVTSVTDLKSDLVSDKSELIYKSVLCNHVGNHVELVVDQALAQF